MAQIVVSEFMDEASVERLAAEFDVIYDPALVDHPAKLEGTVGDARALIVRNRTQVRGELLESAKRLTCIGRLGVGLDNIDLEACKARGIAVYPATGANDLSVAEYVIMAALMLVRRAWSATGAVASGAWPREQSVGGEIAGRTLGLVGYGSIAREVGWRARAMGMEILAHDPFVDSGDPAWRAARNVSLDDLLQQGDVISLHVPLTEDTRHLIDARAIALMKPGAVLINAARGGVVEEAALVGALRGGRIGGAALDVFEKEPLNKTSGMEFEGLDNLLLTPHIAGVTMESNRRVSELTASNVARHLKGSI